MSNFVDSVTENATTILLLAVTLVFLNSMWINLDNNALNIDWDKDVQGDKPDVKISSLLTGTLTAFALWFAGLCFASMTFDEKYDVWLRIACVAAVIVLIVGTPIIGG